MLTIGVLPAAAQSIYAGHWGGGYSGSDHGTCSMNITSYGTLSGSCNGAQAGYFSIAGTVDAQGNVSFYLSAGGSSSGTFTGRFSSTTVLAGTWYIPTNGYSGTWSMTRQDLPGAPIIGTATAGNAQATVTFAAPISDGGAPITGYRVTSNPAGGVDTNGGTPALSHLVTGLKNGTAYTFAVTATNSAGTGPSSSPSNSVRPAAPTPECTLTASPATIAVGTFTTLSASCWPAATSYAWTASGFGPTVGGGTVSPASTTTYSVTGSNALGAGPTAKVTVKVVVPPTCTLTASPASIAVGGGSMLTVVCVPAADSLKWTNAWFASNTTSGVVWPKSTAIYAVTGSIAGVSGNNAVATVIVNTGTPVLSPLSGIKQLSAGPHNTCAVTTSGGAKCWGSDALISDNTGMDRQPVDVLGLSSGVAAVSAGAEHTCAVTTAGGVKCWGDNSHGQLGDNGATKWGSAPVDVIGLSSGVRAISAGLLHTCVLTVAGGVKCWGDNSFGQLGDNTWKGQLTPVDVLGLNSGVAAISAGEYHTCVVTTAGGAKCWGSNHDGELGDNTVVARNTPVDVSGLRSGVAAISAGGEPSDSHTCAVTTAGGVKCWGANSYGQLGDNSVWWANSPVDVSGLSSGVAAVSAGGSHTCAVTTAGGVKCWGFNVYGQLGNNTKTDSLSPVAPLQATFTAPIGGAVTEFYNVNLDNYFITADPNEAAAIDRGSAGGGWSRTGNSFKSGGSSPVCRFYGSVSPGPNSHFFTANLDECGSLMQLQTNTPATLPRWNFESLDFFSTPAIDGVCPNNMTPLYRAYNNGFARGVDSNHRITSNQGAIAEVVARGWENEGVVMCAPN